MSDHPSQDDAPAADEPTAAPSPPAPRNQVPWPATMAVTWLFGVVTGALLAYAIGWVPVSVVLPAPASAAEPPTAPERTPEPEVADRPLEDPVRVDAADIPAPPEESTTQDPLTETTTDPEPTVETDPADAVLVLAATDEAGDALPPAVAVLVTEQRALVPLDAIVGARRAELEAAGGAAYTVTAVIGHSVPHGLALVELASPVTQAHTPPREPGPRSGEVAFLHESTAGRPKQVTVALRAAEADLFTGGPRVAAEPTAPFAGAVIDEEGALLAIFPTAGEPGLPVEVATGWLTSDNRVAFDAFLRVLGPGTPTARLRRARKLLDDGRFEEATREFLVLTAEEPRLIDDAGDDLERAALAATREQITTGDGPAAYALLGETLNRLPEAAELWAQQGRVLAMLQDLHGAIRSFAAAAELLPTSAKTFMAEARGLLLSEVNNLRVRDELASASALLLEHRGSFPDDGPLRVTAGDLLMQLRRFARAADLFDEAARVDAQVAGAARRDAERAPRPGRRPRHHRRRLPARGAAHLPRLHDRRLGRGETPHRRHGVARRAAEVGDRSGRLFPGRAHPRPIPRHQRLGRGAVVPGPAALRGRGSAARGCRWW